MTFPIKAIIKKIHLWIGLVTGAIILVVALTGCIYAFQEEIQNVVYSFRHVEEKSSPILPPSELIGKAELAMDGEQAKRVYYFGKERSAVVLFFGDKKYHQVFLNPYTGAVLKVKNMRKDFFTIVLYLHISLLLPYGDLIVAYATLSFFIMIVSGIVLWWPKKNIKQRFSVKWRGAWRRVNYDLHSVLGFYASWIAIFLVITGLVFSFSWMKSSVRWLFTWQETNSIAIPKPQSDTTAVAYENILDKVFFTIKERDSQEVALMLPQKPSDLLCSITNLKQGTFYTRDYRYWDQYTGEESNFTTSRGRYKNTSIADKVLRMNYDIHTGGIAGFAGKLAMFFTSLVVFSMPITGFLLWKGRKRKSNYNKKKGPRAIPKQDTIIRSPKLRARIPSKNRRQKTTYHPKSPIRNTENEAK